MELNHELKRLENLKLIAKIKNPTYLATNTRKQIFSVTYDGEKGGLISFSSTASKTQTASEQTKKGAAEGLQLKH